MARVHDVSGRQFRALFGLDVRTTTDCWNLIINSVPEKGTYRHLLWALMFMKVYATEEINSIITQADPATFRKWVSVFIELISKVKMVRTNIILSKWRTDFVDSLGETIGEIIASW